MSASFDRDLLRRLVEFELDRQRRSSERVDQFDWGRLILNPPTSALWSDNFLEVRAPQLGPRPKPEGGAWRATSRSPPSRRPAGRDTTHLHRRGRR